MKKETWVRTDRTFQIEDSNLRIFCGNTVRYLEAASLATLEAQLPAPVPMPLKKGPGAWVPKSFGTAVSNRSPRPPPRTLGPWRK